MDQQAVQVKLPADLYERIRQVAAGHNRSLETVVVESLALLFGDTPRDLDTMLASLDAYGDEQLWALVYQRLAWPASTRLHELVAMSQADPLSPSEQAELESLLDQVDQFTLLRSKALVLLQQRGYNVKSRLQMGA